MRCHRLVLTFFLLAGSSHAVRADEIVLKGGKVLTTARPLVVKGKNAVATLKDGTVVSLPLAEIDQAKTAEANKPKTVAAPAVPAVRKPETPAEAARMKNGRKAAISLSDDDVSHPFGPGTSEAKAKEEGDGHVEIVSVSVKKEKLGYTLSGSVFNNGKADVLAVAVTVEAVGEGNKTLATAFANIAKDSLSPGEKSAFTAEVSFDGAVSNFRYVPHWQSSPVARTVTGGNLTDGSSSEQAAATAGASKPNGAKAGAPKTGEEAVPERPAAKPAPKPEPTRAPQPDYAPPAANAPIGAPVQPGGTYLPQPSAQGQPKQPGS